MAKATPKATKTAAPKGTPKSAAATPSASGSASKKRVRVVESAADEDAPETPAKGANKKAKKGENKADKGESPMVGKNGVERKDLKDKMPEEIEKIRSADAPKPEKGALKKTAETEKKGAKGKGKGKKQEVEEEEEDEVKLDEEADGSGDEDEDDESFAYLEGFESGDEDGEDSSDEEEEEQAGDAKGKGKAGKGSFKVEQLPKVKGETVQKKLDVKEKKQPKTGTVYLGRIPRGFYEEEMKSYFSQFGEVTRLRLSRNKQTGASKHYAFIEFKYASVAQIVQETMDNYLLAGHILVCKVIPDDQIHPKMWIGANRKFRVVPKARREAARRNKPKTEKQQESIKKRLLSREEKKREKLAELGIDYDFDGYAKAGQKEEEPKEEVIEEAAPAKGAKGKKGRKSAGGEEPAKKKPRKSK
ncbi:Ribosome biogenesis protein 15 [Rhodotorula toruloides]|uniref:BY PROTMAP: gi/472588553/gb/EMS26025.1/ ribosomal biogenesis protein Gar2 [Rhodosporidium toruloides NP11] gi/647396342/emb/CDR38436.1/ RHTO0S03e09494g1_1 [Rhodosporidium toruloides] n=1 Tax=Rhodotorula toruloides TaxID=5286 RepID=A0A0K3C4Q2_RHOTO|nr:Ribosome biogenesis protein 15 [Rhodotorula toruloides]